jgi:cation transporter-like permease
LVGALLATASHNLGDKEFLSVILPVGVMQEKGTLGSAEWTAISILLNVKLAEFSPIIAGVIVGIAQGGKVFGFFLVEEHNPLPQGSKGLIAVSF